MATKTEIMTRMTAENGYDVTIVCCSTAKQAQFWTQRLDQAKGSVVPADGLVIAVDEDWAGGGAGNGLGTLYAWQKACKAVQERTGRDIATELAEGQISASLFHTAGKGTRMAPLPGGENNNKPGVKLPASVELNDNGTKVQAAVSILESVIRQVNAYAASRKGRLSVYWGDQVFIPSADPCYTPTHDADILCSLSDMPSKEVWVEKGLEKYGLIAVNDEGNAAQVEKVDYDTATALLKNLGSVTRVGTSLGSFSLSATLLLALCGEYAAELAGKEAKFDTDPHWWMPLTLEKDGYMNLMETKGEEPAVSGTHWERMAAFKSGYKSEAKGLFGAVDIGDNCYWWDYGLMKLYLQNVLLLTKADGEEAEAARTFFGVSLADGSVVTESSYSKDASNVSNSVLANVNVKGAVNANGAILVNCTAASITAGPGCILYNVCDESPEGIVLKDGDVRVGVFTEDPATAYFEMNSSITTDGGKTFKTQLEGNAYSFQDVYDMNKDADCIACTALGLNKHREAASKF